MNRITILAGFATATAAGLLVAAPASATTEHCPSGGTKTEVEYGGTTLTGLNPGDTVCVKAGTRTLTKVIGDDGTFTQDAIMNKPGNAYLGISYYVVYPCEGDDCQPPPA